MPHGYREPMGLVVLAACLALAACGSSPATPGGTRTTSTPTSTAAEPRSPGTTAAAAPGAAVVAQGWGGTKLASACLSVNQHYPGIEPPPVEPVQPAASVLLKALGVAAGGPACDATISFDLTGTAIAGDYSGKRLYGGASYTGKMTLSGAGRPTVVANLSARTVLTVTSSDMDTPAKAPWSLAWPGPLLQGLTAVFGPSAVVAAIAAWPTPSQGTALLSESEYQYITDTGEMIVDQLLKMRGDSNSKVSELACMALGQLVSTGAVSKTSQSRIITALIDDVTARGRENPSADALRQIFLAKTPGYKPAPFTVERGTITMLWDAAQWRQWAKMSGLT